MIPVFSADKHRFFLGQLRRFGVDFVQRETDAHDVRLLAFCPMAVRGRDKGAVGQQLKPGVGGVRPFGVVEQPQAALPFTTVHYVVVGADPAHEIPVARADARRVAKNDEQTAIRRVSGRMAVAGQAGGELHGFRPGDSFVVAERDERIEFSAVFTQ